MNWVDLVSAIALVMILEGLVPFISPSAYKNLVKQMAELPDIMLRRFSLILVVIGSALLYLVRS